MTVPKIGEIAPDFEVKTDSGDTTRLSDYRGKQVILYFYPRANTPGCSTQACAFRDDFDTYNEIDAVILGVSPDTVRKQSNFKTKYDLPFPLLADVQHEVSELYGVWQLKKFMGREFMGVVRTTFLIGTDGKIQHIFEGVKPAKNSQEVLEFLT